MKVAGVILAGGQARRMGGGDKSLLNLGGRSILSRVIDRILPQVDTVVLNANGDPSRFAQFGLSVVPDTFEGYAGPLAGVLAGLDWAAENGYDDIVTVAADTPFFPDKLTHGLQMAREGAETHIAMAMTMENDQKLVRHPTFGLWSVDTRESLRQALSNGVRKVITWSDAEGCADMVFNMKHSYPFFNVNTPEDLAKAEDILKELE